jgi:hypothetical protein
MSAETAFQLRQIARQLGGLAYRYGNEIQLQDRIAGVLASSEIGFEREFVLDKTSRADFRLASGVLIEVKVDGSLGPALSQAVRYLALPGVSGVLIATTCPWARKVPPFQAAFRQRLAVVHLQRQAL